MQTPLIFTCPVGHVETHKPELLTAKPVLQVKHVKFEQDKQFVKMLAHYKHTLLTLVVVEGQDVLQASKYKEYVYKQESQIVKLIHVLHPVGQASHFPSTNDNPGAQFVHILLSSTSHSEQVDMHLPHVPFPITT